jgi:hypothetical protein
MVPAMAYFLFGSFQSPVWAFSQGFPLPLLD